MAITALAIAEAVALALMQKKAGEIYDSTVGNISLADLQRNTVRELSVFIRDTVFDALAQQKINDAESNLIALQRTMLEYNNSPSDDRLFDATSSSQQLIANLEHPSIALRAHHIYFLAAGLRLAILQEREKRFGGGEAKNVYDTLLLYMDHGYKINSQLGKWIADLMTPIIVSGVEGSVVGTSYCFKFDKDRYCHFANVTLVDPDGEPGNEYILSEAEARQLAEREHTKVRQERGWPISRERLHPALDTYMTWLDLVFQYEKELNVQQDVAPFKMFEMNLEAYDTPRIREWFDKIRKNESCKFNNFVNLDNYNKRYIKKQM